MTLVASNSFGLTQPIPSWLIPTMRSRMMGEQYERKWELLLARELGRLARDV